MKGNFNVLKWTLALAIIMTFSMKLAWAETITIADIALEEYCRFWIIRYSGLHYAHRR